MTAPPPRLLRVDDAAEIAGMPDGPPAGRDRRGTGDRAGDP
ncbi:hypothetical protein [Actinomadura fibrosa]|uniref:Uncharacterized protein n=1 Tax=Actinomadura fibrosa TaxID=111802 RepID=A0ABW2XPM6_9ACTN|nr:hypothetical protein [Actinomadura fibrosa]